MFRELRLPSSGGPRVAVAVALALVLTLELLRAWAVSMPLFYQGFLQISKPLLGLTVFSPFLVAFVAALFFGRRAERAAVAGARVQTGATDTSSARPGSARRAGEAAVLRGLFIVVAADRIVLQFVGGGVPRMVAALVGLAACLTLLVALAPRRGVAPGLVAGLAGDTVLLMALKTESLVFRNGVAALVGAILLAGAFAAAGWWAARAERAPMRTGMPLWAWLGFSAALVVHLTITSLPAPLETATGWGAAATRVLLAASYGGAALLSFWIAGWSARAWRRRAVCSSLSLACFAVMFAGVLSGGPYGGR